MAYNDELVKSVFSNLSTDKSRLPSSGLTGVGVPSYVGEWLLDKIIPGSGPLTEAEQERLNSFIQKAFPRKDDKQVIFFDLTQGNICKLIALMQVRIKVEQEKEEIPDPVAQIPTLNLGACRIPIDLVSQHKMLLRQGLWGKITLTMKHDGKIEVVAFDPFQCSDVDLQTYANCRAKFENVDDWRDVVFCSMGLNPEHPGYNREAKKWILARLLPLVESNYHCLELAPKGTGKSFFFENISSKVTVVSGGKVTPARLFIDGRSKEVGLLGRHDVVVLDEVQSLTFDNPDELIGPLKNYLASGRYNRAGFADISSDCSVVMLANIELNQQQLPRNENNLIADLPRFFYETAFLDRIAGIIPGWKIPKFHRDMVAAQLGLKMDFFGEALLSLRRDTRFYDYAKRHTIFSSQVSVRDQNSILKSAAGFLKILYPHLKLSLDDFKRDCLDPAQELRQYLRNILFFLDDEFKAFGRIIDVDVE